MQIERDAPGHYWIQLGRLKVYTRRQESPYWGVWQTNGGWEVSLGHWQALVSLLDAEGRPLDRAAAAVATAETAAVMKRLQGGR